MFVWGFTGVLGRLIEAPSVPLVWARMSIATLFLLGYALFAKKSLKLEKGLSLKTLGVGAIIAAHWITFFGAIKASNVSIALACMSIASLFTAFLEPLFFKRKISVVEVVLGVVVVIALYLIFNVETRFQLGIITAVVSAFLAALFTVLNGLLIKKTGALKLTFTEMLGGVGVITAYMFLTSGMPNVSAWFQVKNHNMGWFYTAPDIIWMVVLGTICTGVAFLISIQVMKVLSPFTVALSVNLEPIYAIIMAFLLFNEHENLSPTFFVGTGLILAVVLVNAYLQAKENRKLKKSLHQTTVVNTEP